MKFLVAGLSYQTAPVALRERLAVPAALRQCSACRLRLLGDFEELVLLSTCNRVELYGTTPRSGGHVRRLFQDLAGSARVDLAPHLYMKEGDEAVRHLFSVAGGLDSMVLGETEITGQVKTAYQTAQQAGLTGRVLNRLFQTALQTAKEIRTRTQIGRGAVSVGSVAVELAERIFDRDLADKTVMIIGAGKMGEACVRHLAKMGARSVVVANRSFDRAQELAAGFGGRAIRFDECLTAMVEADIVVSSTGCPDLVLRRDDVAALLPARGGRPLFLIDIAVPRDIDPAVQQLDNVFLYNIDHLEGIVCENARLREQELGRCREIVARRAQEVMARLTGRPGQANRPATAAPPAWELLRPALCPT